MNEHAENGLRHHECERVAGARTLVEHLRLGYRCDSLVKHSEYTAHYVVTAAVLQPCSAWHVVCINEARVRWSAAAALMTSATRWLLLYQE